MDLKLDDTGDLDVTNGNLTLLDGVEAVRQHWKIRNKFFLGEWFLDTRIGVAYYQTIFLKGTPLSVVRTIFRKVAQRTPGIARVDKLVADFDLATRRLKLEIEGKLDPALVAGDPSFRFEFDEFIIEDQVV